MSTIDLGIDHLSDAVVIGQGGFSTVYAATNDLLGQRVAVKVLGRLNSETDRRRFEKECRVMGQLSGHRTVVTVHHAGYTRDGSPYLVMDLIGGGTLADRLRAEGAIPWTRAVDYALAVADALGHAHRADILHRDVKPENVLLDQDRARLTDFGIAYLRDAAGATSTVITASWLHTPPETFTNNRDERSDLYSLASTLYQLIAGSAPFWNPDDESLNPLMYRLLNQPPPHLPAELAPVALDDVLQRCLAKEPALRPATAGQLAAELQAIRTATVADTAAVPSLPPPGPGQRMTSVAAVDLVVPDSSAVTDPTVVALPGGPSLATTAGAVKVPGATVAAAALTGGAGGGPGADRVEPVDPEVGRATGRRRPWLALAVVVVAVVVAAVVIRLMGGGGGDADGANASGVDLAGETVGDGPIVLEGHEAGIVALAVLADGRLASASDDFTVRVWDPDGDAADAVVLEGHEDWVRAVTEVDGGYLASGSEDGTVRLWDLDDPEAEPVVFDNGEYPVAVLARLEDGRLASGGEDGMVHLLDPVDLTEVAAYQSDNGAVRSVAAVDADRLVASGTSGTIELWDLSDDAGPVRFEGHTGSVLSLASLGAGRFVSGSEDGTVRVWNADDGAGPEDDAYEHGTVVSAVTVLADGAIAFADAEGLIMLWTPGNAEAVQIYDAGNRVRALVTLDDGRLASGSQDGVLRIWPDPA